MAKKLEDMLGEKGKNPETATPDGTNGEENPLEKMDKISKEKPEEKDKGSKELDADVLAQMFKTGENTDGMFTPKEEKEVDGVKVHEEEDEDAKLKVGKEVKPSEKYEKQFKDDMLKHPDQYKINTPRGEMTVSEAMKAGYNPITKSFDEEKSYDKIREKHLSRLNDADRGVIEQITSPSAAQVAPADAEKYGLQPGSPMIRQEQPGAMPGMEPSPAAATPIGGALPGSEESMAAGGVDLSSILGGGQ